MRVLAEERRRIILSRAVRDGQVYTAQMAEEFQVAEETIRRDIRALLRTGRVRKVHGGAMLVREPARECPYGLRAQLDQEAKLRIGRHAASLVEDGDVLALDSGGATEQMARALTGVRGITVVTNGLPIVQILTEKLLRGEFTGRVLSLGGQVNCDNRDIVGPMAIQMAHSFRYTRAFLSASALSEQGPMMWTEQEGCVSAAFASQAAQVCLLAESVKFSLDSFYTYLSYDSVHEIVTDASHPVRESVCHALERAGVRLVVLGGKEGAHG